MYKLQPTSWNRLSICSKDGVVTRNLISFGTSFTPTEIIVITKDGEKMQSSLLGSNPLMSVHLHCHFYILNFALYHEGQLTDRFLK